LNVQANLYDRGIPYASEFYYVNFNDGRSSELDRALRFDIKHQATISSLVQLTSRLYADSFDYQRRLTGNGAVACLSNSAALCQYYDAGMARWIGLEERLTLNWLRDQTLVTTLGIDARERQVGAKQDQLDAGTGRPIAPTTGRLDDSGPNLGAYIQQTWNPATWVDLNAGARLDIANRFAPVLSPRGAAMLRPFEKTTFKVIYSQAFRAPTWAETSLSNNTVVPSLDLRPEKVRSVEALVEQRFGAQQLRLGAFTTRWTDLVETAPVPPEVLARLQTSGVLRRIYGNVVQSNNVARINNYGLSAGWQGASLDGTLRYGANLTWAYARTEKGDLSTPILAAPSVFGNAHIDYDLGPDLPTLAFAVQAMGKRPADRTTPTGGPIDPAPAMADLHLAVTGRVPHLASLGYILTVDYLTASRGPYTAGPDLRSLPSTQSVLEMLPAPGYAPVDQLRIMVGLRIDLFDTRSTNAPEAP
jgi:outer membrane receptor protein involved in Fe transport